MHTLILSLFISASLLSLSAQAEGSHWINNGSLLNDDGSMTIYGPAFIQPDGTQIIRDGSDFFRTEILNKPQRMATIPKYLSYGIHSNSDGNEICKRLGFDSMVTTEILGSIYNLTILIDKTGKETLNAGSAPLVAKITCRRDQRPPVLDVTYKRLSSGKYLLIEPRFKFDGSRRKISAQESDLDGVCRLFGFGAATTDDVSQNKFKDTKTTPVVIDANGYFNGIAKGPRGKLRIQRLLCELNSPNQNKDADL